MLVETTHTPPDMCYHPEFDPSTSKGIGIEETHNWGRWVPAPCDCPLLLEMRPPTYYPAEYVHSVANGTGIITEI